ncbi:MAG: hypothetical protein SGJ24_01890 [Chloroflexota bacterium]|nr:hypothetical protein [Chloroflexota bacterium]
MGTIKEFLEKKIAEIDKEPLSQQPNDLVLPRDVLMYLWLLLHRIGGNAPPRPYIMPGVLRC